MYGKLNNKGRLPAAAGRVFLAGWLALLAATGPGAQAADGTTENPDADVLWSAYDDSLTIIDGDDAAHRELCPKKPGARQQPFCRKFAAPLLVACGNSTHVQLVLRNGEVHHLDSALIGADGSMRPAFTPTNPMQLISAWIPLERCRPEQGFAAVFAVDRDGRLWQFDGRQWRSLPTQLMGSAR